MKLYDRASKDATVTPISKGYRLRIPVSTQNQYHLAQTDDYAHLPRHKFCASPPSTFSLQARASSESIPGTWGFGLWNDPFGLSLGFGGNPFSLPALPNAIWFFHASPKNHLSFHNNKPAQGFLGQTFSSPRFHPLLLPIGLLFPFSKTKARQLLSRIIAEDSATINIDVTQWHRYRFEWSPSRSTFWVDDALLLDTAVSPQPPLGLVIWIDNQYAAFTPNGELKWGLENNLSEAWLEIENIQLTP
jgi:hypothetical protein